MADISAEPSMEDILSSIKRIIAEEADTQPGGIKRPARPGSAPSGARLEPGVADDGILELSDPVEPTLQPASQAVPEPETELKLAAAPEAAPHPPRPEPQPEAPGGADPILSPRTAEAMRAPFDALSRMVVKPEIAGADTLEGMVREMLRPMLREWLDSNLPGMVETMVAREIDRITGK